MEGKFQEPDKVQGKLFEDDLNHLYQGCNHKDKCQSLEILQSEWIEYIFLNTPSNDGCQGQDKGDGSTHTDGCINLLRYAQKGQIPRNCDKTILLTNIAEININKYSIISIS